MKSESNILDVETLEQLESQKPGQVIRKNGRIGVYAGLEWEKTCGCLSTPNVFQFPVIVYPSGDSNKDLIKREVVRTLEPPMSDQITSISISGPVDREDHLFEHYRDLLRDNHPNYQGN